MEQPTTSQPCFLNSAAWLENSTISVGQTKVKSRGQKKRSSHLLLKLSRESSLNSLVELIQELALKKGATLPMVALRTCVVIARYIEYRKKSRIIDEKIRNAAPMLFQIQNINISNQAHVINKESTNVTPCIPGNSSDHQQFSLKFKNLAMDKFTDSGMPDTISPGLYSQSDILDIENLQKMKYAVDLTILCNRVCFREFSAPMTNEQKECHTGCFDNFYSALLYTQRKFYEEVNKK